MDWPADSYASLGGPLSQFLVLANVGSVLKKRFSLICFDVYVFKAEKKAAWTCFLSLNPFQLNAYILIWVLDCMLNQKRKCWLVDLFVVLFNSLRQAISQMGVRESCGQPLFYFLLVALQIVHLSRPYSNYSNPGSTSDLWTVSSWAWALFRELLLPSLPTLISAHRLVIGQDVDSYSSFPPRSINRFQQIGQPVRMLAFLLVELISEDGSWYKI